MLDPLFEILSNLKISLIFFVLYPVKKWEKMKKILSQTYSPFSLERLADSGTDSGCWTGKVTCSSDDVFSLVSGHLLTEKGKCIRITSLWKYYPLKPNFYLIKLGFLGIHTFLIVLLLNIHCGYPVRTTSVVYPPCIFS